MTSAPLVSSPTTKPVRVALLTEIISPYRIPVFNALARQKGIELHVVFLAETDPTQRRWLVYKDEIEFSYEVLPAWRRRWGARHILLNRGLWQALQRFRPDSILCGGYNYPAFWEALTWAKFHSARFVAWIESTSRDQRNPSAPAAFIKQLFIRTATHSRFPASPPLSMSSQWEFLPSGFTRRPML